MSKQNFPIPTSTPICDETKYSGLRFGMIWNRFFKAIGDDVLKANTITTDRNLPFSYVVNMNIVVVTWYSQVPLPSTVIQLPYPAALAFDAESTVHEPGTQSITIEAGTLYTRFWYIADFGKG